MAFVVLRNGKNMNEEKGQEEITTVQTNLRNMCVMYFVAINYQPFHEGDRNTLEVNTVMSPCQSSLFVKLRHANLIWYLLFYSNRSLEF